MTLAALMAVFDIRQLRNVLSEMKLYASVPCWRNIARAVLVPRRNETSL